MLFTSQITACGPFCTVALNCSDVPCTILAFAGEMLICGPGSGFTVTIADADFVASACKTAVTVTVRMFETFVGAVYETIAGPAGVIVPTNEFPPGIPFACQVTAGFEAF
jgi:hypothetical protein